MAKKYIVFIIILLCAGLVYWKRDACFNHCTPISSNEAYVLSEVRHGATFGQPLIGGAFSLVDQNGQRRTDKDFRGRWLLVYFGYTFCPDICPMALENIGATLKKLGPKAKNIQVVFITVDPERDDQKTLKQFLENYDSRIVGLTGTRQEVDTAMAAYRVNASKNEDSDPEHYLMGHSSLIYVVSPQGQYVESFNHETPADEMIKALESKL